MKALTLPALLLSASPLWALTPQEVLADWQGFSARNGAGFTFARQDSSAAEITLYDVKLGGGVRPLLPWLTLAPLPDGTVEITTASAFRWESGADGYLDNGQVNLTNLQILASGPADDISFQFALDRYAQNSTLGISAFLADIETHLTGLSGTLRHSFSEALGDQIFIDLRAADWYRQRSQSQNETIAAEGHFGLENFAFSGAFNMARLDENRIRFSSGKALQSQDGEAFRTVISAGSIDLVSSTHPDAPEIQLAVNDMDISSHYAAGFMPSFAYSLGTLRLNAAIQERALGAPYPWQLEAQLGALALSPDTWEGLDPESTLPHGLGQLDLRLSGTGQIPEGRTARFPLMFLMSITELKSLNLAQLDISFAGLALQAAGDVTFGEIRSPFSPPSPNGGQMSLRLQGAKTLLDVASTVPALADLARELSKILEQAAPLGQPANTLNLRMAFQPDGAVSYSPLPD